MTNPLRLGRRLGEWLDAHWRRLTLAAFVLIALGGGYILQEIAEAADRAEVTRCEDNIVGRAKQRYALPGMVDAMARPDASDPAQLDLYIARGRAYLERYYGPPPCAERLGLDVAEVERRNRDDITVPPPSPTETPERTP